MTRMILLIALCSAAACGKKSDDASKHKDDAALGPTVAPVAKPLSGVDQIRRFNFIYGEGQTSHSKAAAAYMTKPQHDWPAVRAHAEAALGRDSGHLDAHWLLGIALAQSGEPA